MHAPNPDRPIAAASPGIDADFPTMMQLATFTLWLVCAAVGAVGMIWGFKPLRADNAPAPTKVLTIDVSTNVPSPPDADPAPPAPSPPAMPQTVLPPAPPAPPAMAIPAPEIAFAVPTPAAPKVVARAAAASIAPAAPPAAVHSAATVTPHPGNAGSTGVHHLAFGQGLGQYIRREYPEEAKDDGEQGSVTVQFTMDDQGHVTEAHVVAECRYPILNRAALKAVRGTVFPPGQTGLYEIPFVYQFQ